MSTETISTNRHQIAPDAVAGLRERCSGEVLLPSDLRYDEARTLWNGMIDRRPALVVRANGTADVREAVLAAQEFGMSLGVRAGGHNVAGNALIDGCLLLDLTPMNGVTVDPRNRTAVAQGGALWRDFDRATSLYGLATTAGVISTTGVGGLTLGGGIGWLVGKHGMTIDNLLSAEIVTADGQVLHISEQGHPDLFWAIRGGGGNFGVVTAFEFQLHPLTDVLAGAVIFTIDQAREAIEHYREITEQGPDELTTYFAILTDPESGQRVCAYQFCYSGDLFESEQVIKPLLSGPTPAMEMYDTMPFVEWQSASDHEFPHGRHYYWKSNLHTRLADETLEAIVEHGSFPEVDTCMLFIENYTGAFNRVAPTATAYAHRDANYQLVITGGADDPADVPAATAWTRRVYEATAPYAKPQQFLNFNSFETDERAQRVRLGYGENWERLVRIKRQYDPQNVFRANNNIPPDAEIG